MDENILLLGVFWQVWASRGMLNFKYRCDGVVAGMGGLFEFHGCKIPQKLLNVNDHFRLSLITIPCLPVTSVLLLNNPLVKLQCNHRTGWYQFRATLLILRPPRQPLPQNPLFHGHVGNRAAAFKFINLAAPPISLPLSRMVRVGISPREVVALLRLRLDHPVCARLRSRRRGSGPAVTRRGSRRAHGLARVVVAAVDLGLVSRGAGGVRRGEVLVGRGPVGACDVGLAP